MYNFTEVITVSLFSLFTAVIYSACFTGVKVYPQLSLFIFTLTALAALYFLLKKLSYLKNMKAFKWAAPLVIISTFNAVFHLNHFSYANVIAVHLMFAALSFSAVSGEDNELSDFSGWINLIKVCIGNIAIPFRFLKSHFGGKKEGRNIPARIAAGIMLALPALIVITVMLMDADAVFGAIMNRMLHSVISLDVNIFGHIAAVVIATAYLTGYIFNLNGFKKSETRILPHKLDIVTGSAFLTPINLLFLFFCIIQTIFLFTGGYMKLPERIVYSAYAREGFFQLLFVTVINFGVLIIFIKLFPDCVKNKAIKLQLAMLCIFTGILIISSFYRMFLYIDAYGYTDIRMMVITFLAMESVLIVVTLVYLFKPDTDFIKRYVYISVVFYMLVNITSSAYVVGRLNINRFYAGKDLDIYALCRNAETAGLLVEVYTSAEFNERIQPEQKTEAYNALYKYGGNAGQKWQNISIISSLGNVKAGNIIRNDTGGN